MIEGSLYDRAKNNHGERLLFGTSAIRYRDFPEGHGNESEIDNPFDGPAIELEALEYCHTPSPGS